MAASKFRRLGIIFVVGLSVLGFGAQARAQEDHVVMTLPANVMQFLGIYAARDLGFWRRHGLDVKTILVPGVGSFNAVVAGSAEFAVSSGAALTRAAALGERMLAIANMIDKPVWSVVTTEFVH